MFKYIKIVLSGILEGIVEARKYQANRYKENYEIRFSSPRKARGLDTKS